MSCIYSDSNGYCTVWDKEIEMVGCNSNGACVAEDNPNPSYTCQYYESMDSKGDEL